MSSRHWTKSFSLELLQGIHDFRADSFKIALYTGASAISDASTGYTSSGEVSGPGYSSGGASLPVSSGYPMLVNDSGAVRFDKAQWLSPSTFTYRKAMIYNASKANRAILVVDFGIDRGPSNGSHSIETPLSYLPLVYINRG